MRTALLFIEKKVIFSFFYYLCEVFRANVLLKFQMKRIFVFLAALAITSVQLMAKVVDLGQLGNAKVYTMRSEHAPLLNGSDNPDRAN